MQGRYYLSRSANATRFPPSFILSPFLFLSNPARCESFVKMKNSTLLLPRVGGLPFLSRSSAVASPPPPPPPLFFSLSFFLRRNQWESIEISLSKRSTDLFDSSMGEVVGSLPRETKLRKREERRNEKNRREGK